MLEKLYAKLSRKQWIDAKTNPPRVEGWYLTTNTFSVGPNELQSYTMLLYYYPDSKKWINNCAQNVFQMYNVLGYNNKRVLTDSGCDRTEDVAYWCPAPEPFIRPEDKERTNLHDN